MPPFGTVGQEPGSADCSFFCGYVVYLAHQRPTGHGLGLKLMTQEQVYNARDDHLRRARTGSMLRSGHSAARGSSEVEPFMVALDPSIRYRLHVPTNYTQPSAVNPQTRRYGSQTEIRRAINEQLDNAPNGIIVPITGRETPVGEEVSVCGLSDRGHVVVIWSNTATTWYVYDPFPDAGPQHFSLKNQERYSQRLGNECTRTLIVPRAPEVVRVPPAMVPKCATQSEQAERLYDSWLPLSAGAVYRDGPC